MKKEVAKKVIELIVVVLTAIGSFLGGQVSAKTVHNSYHQRHIECSNM